MTDEPEHGPDSSTPPSRSGTRKATGKTRKKQKRRTRAKKATASPRQSGKKSTTRRLTPRGSAADVERLKTLVLERILLGERRRDILRYLAKAVKEKEFPWPDKDGPAPRTVDYYIAKATEELRELSTVERAEAMAAARGRFLMIMRKAHDAKDYSTFRLANRDLARIDGLEPVRVQHSGSVITEHTGTVEHTHTHRPASIDEQAAAIRDLFGRAGARALAAQAAAKTN